MSWKDILKSQSSLFDFGMRRPEGSIPRENSDRKALQRLEEIKSKLMPLKGRTKTTERGGKVEDLATVRLDQITEIENMPMGEPKLDAIESLDNDNLKYFIGEK